MCISNLHCKCCDIAQICKQNSAYLWHKNQRTTTSAEFINQSSKIKQPLIYCTQKQPQKLISIQKVRFQTLTVRTLLPQQRDIFFFKILSRLWSRRGLITNDQQKQYYLAFTKYTLMQVSPVNVKINENVKFSLSCSCLVIWPP